MRIILILTINLFILVTLFDPADLIFHLKVPFFFLCWFAFLVYKIFGHVKTNLPIGLLSYITVMITIPVISIVYYYLFIGYEPYDGPVMLKSYIFISFIVILYSCRINLIPSLSASLTILSIAVILVYFIVLTFPYLRNDLYFWGRRNGMFLLGQRYYTQNYSLVSVYFVTSPMIAFAIAYYSHLTILTNGKKKLFFAILTALNITGMFMAGTRNNMFASILLPIAILLYYSKKKWLLIPLIAGCLFVVVSHFINDLNILFNPYESSNYVKLNAINEYIQIFSDPVNLFFGQGLGAFHDWIGRGPKSATELTYLDIYRYFGIFMGTVIMYLILLPLFSFFNKLYDKKYLLIGYSAYLVMCASNPNFFSSMGMLLLSIIIVDIYFFKLHLKLIRDNYRRNLYLNSFPLKA